jgi:arginyl-tRNA synthetase
VTSHVADPFGDFVREASHFLQTHGVPPEHIHVSAPSQPAFGELASNAPFLLAKDRRQAPRDIASAIAAAFDPDSTHLIKRVEAAPNGFVNFHLNYDVFVPHAINLIEDVGPAFGRLWDTPTCRVLIEHTSVNPNKEWHVGHLRNVVIGDTLVRIARQTGEQVEVQNYIDDTGRQAAEAVLALREYDGGDDAGHKFDEFVGKFYVRLNAELMDGSDERVAELESRIGDTLHEMEEGVHRAFVERVVRAQLETAARIGATYDLLIWESDIVRAHLLEEALEVLRKSPRTTVPDSGKFSGAMVITLDSGLALDTLDDESQYRVLVRSNGIPTYTGKDIAYMMWKFGLLVAKLDLCSFPSAVGELKTSCPTGDPYHPTQPDEVVNVVAEHQSLQQQTVIEGLAAAGYQAESRRAHHLSYGMVSQTGSQISGRRGLGSSADTVLNEAAAVASARIEEKRPDIATHERRAIAEAVAVGSVRYLMVQYGPVKPIVFDIQDVVSFDGNTGLYLQYALVRIGSILHRAEDEYGVVSDAVSAANLGLLVHPTERALVLQLARFPTVLGDALRTLSINLVAEYANGVASRFSQFYRDCPVMQAEHELRAARVRLLRVTRRVMLNAVDVLGIPVVEKL